MLNRYTAKSRIEGSNPSVSAIIRLITLQINQFVAVSLRATHNCTHNLAMVKPPQVPSNRNVLTPVLL